jgi:hypothetical protein
VVTISACHAEDPGLIPGRGVFSLKLCGMRATATSQQSLLGHPSQQFVPDTVVAVVAAAVAAAIATDVAAVAARGLQSSLIPPLRKTLVEGARFAREWLAKSGFRVWAKGGFSTMVS